MKIRLATAPRNSLSVDTPFGKIGGLGELQKESIFLKQQIR